MRYTLSWLICKTILLHCGKCSRRIKIGEPHYITRYGVPFCKEDADEMIRSGEYECIGVVV